VSPNEQQQDHESGQHALAGVFRQRAERLAQRGRQDGGRSAGVPILVLRIGDERFGIELAHVEQVHPRGELTPVPGALPALVGVANLGGVPRSVFDLSQLLNVSVSAAETAFIVVLTAHGKMTGLAVEAVEDVLRFDADQLTPVDDAACDLANGFTKGITDGQIAVLDATSLLQHSLQNAKAQVKGQKVPAGAAANVLPQQESCLARAPGAPFRREA
jgi:chemotaxis signal transduction protein